jgi:hypothetical protein
VRTGFGFRCKAHKNLYEVTRQSHKERELPTPVEADLATPRWQVARFAGFTSGNSNDRVLTAKPRKNLFGFATLSRLMSQTSFDVAGEKQPQKR